MTVGQSVFSVAADVAALDALEAELMVGELDRGAQHAATLRRVLQMNAVYTSSGMSISTIPHAALAMGCSENRAAKLLTEALGLAELPGGIEAVECGLLSVEQAGVLVGQFAPLPLELRLTVWRRLQARLGEQGVLPPARFGELLRRWIVAADRDAAAQRRKAAEQDRRIDARRRDDGLHDLFAFGFRGPDMQAILSRIAARSQPVSIWDERTADQRRFDAVRDLLLGRESLPIPAEDEPMVRHDCGSDSRGGAAHCGCRPGSPAPCGAEVLIHARWEAALELSDEPAELVGHGPIEADLLQDVLLAGPRLRVVWTDEHGVPVAVDDRVVQVPRGDPAALRQALLDLVKRPPPQRQPRSPDDHQPPEPRAEQFGREMREAPPPDAGLRSAGLPTESAEPASPHPADQPGPYRPPRRIRRLVKARAPRCEWPGCGARAQRCDDEHDLVWPDGPTCPCNLGPCCRHHHRVKQLGWVKTRHRNGSLTWTGRTGRSWLSPAQHDPPLPVVRPLPPIPTTSPLDELSPTQLEDELWSLGLLPDDDLRHHQPASDEDVPDRDRLGQRIRLGDTRWTLDLDDPWLWLDSDLP